MAKVWVIGFGAKVGVLGVCVASVRVIGFGAMMWVIDCYDRGYWR